MSQLFLVARHVRSSLYVLQREIDSSGSALDVGTLSSVTDLPPPQPYLSHTRLAVPRRFDMLDLLLGIFLLEHACDSDTSGFLIEIV